MSRVKNILVTGAGGQLGSEIAFLSKAFPYTFHFTDVTDLDISDTSQIALFFDKKKIDVCINCAAYTAVDKAEQADKMAFLINHMGPVHLAEICSLYDVDLIHISTDFVFDGKKNTPYTEEDNPHPISVYGQSKLKGEEILNLHTKTFVFRTSWLYSPFGHNFLNTIMRLGRQKKELGIVYDQIGTPTYAYDLAKIILDITALESKKYGLYHLSNEGVASWYDFAKAILDLSKIAIDLKPIETRAYPTPASRPSYSVLSKRKIKEAFNIDIPYWRDSLEDCLKRIK